MAIYAIAEDQMITMVEDLLNAKMEDEITNAVLDLFHLPHSDEAEQEDSLNDLEAKFPHVAQVVDATTGAITTPEVLGAKAVIEKLIDSIMYTITIDDMGTTADATDDVTTTVPDYTRIAGMTPTQFQAKVREAAIDIVTPVIGAMAVVDKNIKTLVDGEDGKG